MRQIDFFSALPLEVAKVFAYLCTREIFKSGDYLFQQNEDDGQAFYIISGKARLIHREDGQELIIRDYETGSFFGRLALMGSMRRLFSMQAVTDVTCLTITREKFLKALNQFPDQMPRIIKSVVETIQAWEKGFLAHRTESCETCMHKIGVSIV
jgi:CRP-like cAMP-binding protein